MLGIILCEFLCSGSIDEFIKKHNYITKSFYNVHCLFTVFFVLLLQVGWTILHYAVYNHQPEIIKVLISNGANITVVDKV